jgi:hypothetical protein
MERIILTAKDGYIYTNGVDFGKIIYLANGVNASDYHEITEEEYNKILEQENKDNAI